MSEWLDGYIADSEFRETFEETLESFDKEDNDAYLHKVSSLPYLLIRQMIGKWHNRPAELPETVDSYTLECLGRIFSVCLSGNWIDWLRLLKGYTLTARTLPCQVKSHPQFLTPALYSTVSSSI